MKTKRILKNAAVGAVMLAMCAAAAISVASPSLSAKAEALNEAVDGNYFVSDYRSMSEVNKAAEDLGLRIQQEGTVMLKNDLLPSGEYALPLKSARQDGSLKVSVFGKNSSQWDVYSETVYKKYGLTPNPALGSFYGNASRSGPGTEGYVHYNTTIAGKPTGETPWSMYENDSGNVIDSFGEYNDAAIVYLRRYVGEGHDAPQTMYYGEDANGDIFYESTKDGYVANKLMPTAVSADAHFLELDINELDLLENVCERFNNVVLVLITTGPIELEFLNKPELENINAVLWSGAQTSGGGTGGGIASILTGQISPSGRTVDTWYRDFAADPTFVNFGLACDPTAKTTSYTNVWGGYSFYQEGIYSGYRYYETRGYDEKQADPDSTWYEDNVNYPFGYGLSYTAFDWKLVESAPADGGNIAKGDKISVTVEVTNTGSVAGKDVVQLYYTAPYYGTEQDPGIEKAHVVLGGFEKTKLLQPGETQRLTITMDADDMASYDYSDANHNGFKGYELEAGKYVLRIMRNSHEEVANVSCTLAETIKYPSDVTEDENNNNLFDEVSNFLTDDLGKKYMSRSDFEGTFPKTVTGVALPDHYLAKLQSWNGAGGPPADEGQPYYSDSMPVTGKDNGIVLSDLYGLPYDDPMWEDYLDQFTADELETLSAHGRYYAGQKWPQYGLDIEINTDGPGGIGYYQFHTDEYGEFTGKGFPQQSVLAATWNKELAYEEGKLIGNESIWGSTKNGVRETVAGWYAPSSNIHRSPFGGRNGEYLSEDGFHSGTLNSLVVKGAREYGLVTYVKHFAMNDMDTHRGGGNMWANEQTMREVYFKGFEICVKEGDTLGIMSATVRIGVEWAGGCYNLLTKLLREEWGFNGAVVTDYVSPDGFASYDQMIRAGGNLMLADAGVKFDKGSATTVTALRNAAHGLLYSLANSNALNSSSTEPVMPEKITAFNGGELAAGIVNVAYAGSVATAQLNPFYEDLTAADITYSLAEGSAPLPEGLTLNTDGTITGTPEEIISNCRIEVVATCQNFRSYAFFTINITNGDPEIIYSAETIASASLGKPYTATVATASVFAPNASEEEIAQLPEISYVLANGSSLPAGLQLGSDGTISGTPKFAVKDFTFRVTATAEGLASKTVEYKFSVLGELTFGTGTLEAGKYGQSYVGRITPATGGEGITYALKEGSALPGGLTLTAGGYIVGTPTQAVTNHKFTVVAVCDTAPAQEAEYSITIGINYNVAALTVPDGSAGTSYDTRIDMAQGAGDVTYKIVGGELPEGLTLTSDGAITGTPGQAGVFTVTVEAEAEGIASDRTELTLYIAGNASGTDTWFVLCISVVAALIVVSVVAGIVAGKSGRSGSKGGRR